MSRLLAFILAAVTLALAACASPPPPPPRPKGVPVAWPKPEPRKKPIAAAKTTQEPPAPPAPATPPETARPTEDEPNPGEAIQASETAKENATNYVLNPRARAPVIDRLTALTRDVRRARETMEQRRAATGQYDPEDVRALKQASDVLENYRTSKGD